MASATLAHPNAVTDDALGGWVQYRDALELDESRALAQKADPQTVLDEVAAAFNNISECMGGREQQAELYRLTLGAHLTGNPSRGPVCPPARTRRSQCRYTMPTVGA